MVRTKDTVRWGAWQKLWQAVGCLVGTEKDQRERLRMAMTSLRQLGESYETKLPPEMVEEFTEFMESMCIGRTGTESFHAAINDLPPEKVEDAAKRICDFYTGLYRHACNVADRTQETYAELEAENSRLVQENQKLREESQSFRDFVGPEMNKKWRVSRLIKGFNRPEQSAKTKQTTPTPKRTKKSGTTKANTTPRRTKSKRKPKE